MSNPLILGTNSIKDTWYDVANSLRFNGADSEDLERTPSSSGNNNIEYKSSKQNTILN